MNFFSLIPDSLVQLAQETLFDFLSEQAKKYAGEQLAGKLRSLSTQATFKESIRKAIETGAQRFSAEYRDTDKALVEAIRNHPEVLKSPELQKALTRLICSPGAWPAQEQEQVYEKFSSILPERPDREGVNKALTYLLRCITEELWTLPGAKEVREIYSLKFQQASDKAAREQVEIARKQLEATEQLSTEIRQMMLQLVSAIEQKLLTAGESSELLTIRPRPYHNLPRPDYQHFIGREPERAWLRQRLSPKDRAWQIAITGIGGVGKSSLALNIGHEYIAQYHELEPEERFEAIIWISAKEEVLTAYGREKAAVTILHTLEDVYITIANVLDREDIVRAKTIEEQSALIERALQQERILLIMDNLESVTDEKIKPFLRNIPQPSKAIITSREYIDVADNRTLKGLSAEEAQGFISVEANLRDVHLSDKEQAELYELTSGLPLPIKLGIARMASGETFRSVAHWLGDARGDLPEYCVQGQVDLVHRAQTCAWRLLLACSLFDRSSGASQEALGSILDLSLYEQENGLAYLQRLFLMSKNEAGRFWILPIIQRYVRTNLTGEDAMIIDRWIGWLIDYSQSRGKKLRYGLEPLSTILVEYASLLSAIRWCRDQKRWEPLFHLAEGTWNYSYLVGLLVDLEEIINAAWESATNLGNEASIGEVLFQKGRLAWLRGQEEEKVIGILIEAERLLRKHRRMDTLCESMAIRAQFYYSGENRDLDKSTELAKEVLSIGQLSQLPAHVYYGSYRLSAIATARKDFATAIKWLEIAKDVARRMNSLRFMVGVDYRTASNFIEMGRYEEAEKLLLHSIQINTEINERRHIADNKRRLAEVYAKTGRLELARRTAQESYQIYKALGLEMYANRVMNMLQMWEA